MEPDNHTDKIKINSSLPIGDWDKENCLANIFEESHRITQNYSHPNDATVKTTVNAFNSFKNMQCQSPKIKYNEIKGNIKSLKPFKSAGLDRIQNGLLKELPPSAIHWITSIINCCIKSSYWPTSFKIAKVHEIIAQSAYSTQWGKYWKS